MTYKNYRYLEHKLSSYVTLSLSFRERAISSRERKWEIIFPVQTNGLWLCETGLKLKWSEKQCAFAFKSIWPAEAPFPISKTRQLQPITSIHFPFSFSFLSCSCMQKRKCLNDSVICDNYRWSTEAKRLSLTLKWFNLFIFCSTSESEWEKHETERTHRSACLRVGAEGKVWNSFWSF